MGAAAPGLPATSWSQMVMLNGQKGENSEAIWAIYFESLTWIKAFSLGLWATPLQLLKGWPYSVLPSFAFHFGATDKNSCESDRPLQQQGQITIWTFHWNCKRFTQMVNKWVKLMSKSSASGNSLHNTSSFVYSFFPRHFFLINPLIQWR